MAKTANKKYNKFLQTMHDSGRRIPYYRNGEVEWMHHPRWKISQDLSDLMVEAGEIINKFNEVKDGKG